MRVKIFISSCMRANLELKIVLIQFQTCIKRCDTNDDGVVARDSVVVVGQSDDQTI